MKNCWKHTLLSLLAAGSAVLAGCGDDEELNLPGYPETPVGIVIADAENAPTVTVKGTYEAGTGALKLDGELTRTYVFSLSTPSPEDATFHVEMFSSNLPEDRLEISATELKVPAGAISAEVTVGLTDDDMSFMENERGPMNYELGVRLTGVEGSKVTMPQTEAKVIVEKEAYIMNAAVVGTDGGNTAVFKRSCLDGQIVSEEPIAYEFKVMLDKPALRDLTFRAVSTGTPENYKECEAFSGNLTIAAGETESETVTWTLADDFLEGNDDPATYEIVLSVSAQGDAADVTLAEGSDACAITVTKVFDHLEFLSELDTSWTKFDTTEWTTDPSSAYNSIMDNNIYTYYNYSFVIDMKETKSVVGFGITGYGNYSFYLPDVYSISTSEDGQLWAPQGELNRDNAPSATHILKLIRTVDARYIKFEPISGYCFVSKFEVYGKN